MRPLDVLALLRDVPGVVGSYVYGLEGRVLLRDLPASVADDLLVSVGRRCEAALLAANLPMPDSDRVVLRFERLIVLGALVGSNLLVIMAETRATTTSLRAALRIVGAGLADVEPATFAEAAAGHASPAGASASPDITDRPRRPSRVWG